MREAGQADEIRHDDDDQGLARTGAGQHPDHECNKPASEDGAKEDGPASALRGLVPDLREVLAHVIMEDRRVGDHGGEDSRANKICDKDDEPQAQGPEQRPDVSVGQAPR